MVHCSKCQSEIHEDFGVVTCSACGATLIVDLDGEVRDFEQIESVESPPELEQVNTIEDFTESGSFAKGLDVPLPPMESEALDQVPDQVLESSDVEVSELESEPEFGSAIEEFDEWAETVGEEPDISVSVLAQNGGDGDSSTDDVLLEIKDFGNSEVSSAEDGQFLYTLRLDGIDSGDVRDHILQVLQDPRLKMDAESLLAESKNGHLSIRKLNAVKAFVIVNAIKSLPIDIFWEQHDITS